MYSFYGVDRTSISRRLVISLSTSLLLVLGIIFLAGCDRASHYNREVAELEKKDIAASDMSREASPDSAMMQATAANDTTGNSKDVVTNKDKRKQGSPPPADPQWDKKIVKTANIDLEVKQYKPYTKRLYQTIHQFGGYIAQEEQNESPDRIDNTVTIKVPVYAFDEMVQELAGDSDKLIQKKINADDVTMQVVDARSRLETKREVRLRYLELLKEAKKMDEIIQVQHEIDEIQGEMDAASGRIAYLGHTAAFSTVNLHYYQVLNVGVKVDDAPGFWHQIGQSFETGWKWISDALVGLVALWPLWLAVIGAVVGYRKWKRRVKKGTLTA